MVREVLAAREDTGLPPALPDQDSTAGLTSNVHPLSAPPFFATPLSAPPLCAQHILSRWPWVTEDTVKNIALGKFEIDTLPKLHRSDELRNAYLKRSMKGIYQPLDGGPPEIVVGTSKLHSAFRDPTTFFLAWLIYISIRSEFKPEMGTRLASWTEILHYFVKLNYPWPSILEYIIAYFQLYQDRTDTDAWFTPDSTLMAYHLTLVQQHPTTFQHSSSVSTLARTSRPKPNGQKLVEMAKEICLSYNRASGCTWRDDDEGSCPRRHVCGNCISPQHTALTCPK